MKFTKIMSMLLCSAITLNFSGALTAGAAAQRGDINSDDQLNIADLEILQDYLLNKKELSAAAGTAADMTDDKIVNVYDLTAMRKMIIDTGRKLKNTTLIDKFNSGFTDEVKKNNSSAVITSTAQLKEYLTPLFNETIINNYLKKYDDTFFASSVLFMKSMYLAPAADTSKPVAYSGFSESFAGTYTTKGVYTYLNLRKEPNTSSAILGSIYPGDKITVYYGNGAWAQVEHKGVRGFASMEYLQKVSDPDPVIAPDVNYDYVYYDKNKITIALKQSNSQYNGYPVKVVQTAVSRYDYYAEASEWIVQKETTPAVTTTTTTTVKTTTTAKPTTTTTAVTTAPNPAQLYPLAAKELEKVGKDLKSAFNAAAGITYYGHTADMPQDDKTTMEWYADYGFKNRKGNCYVMAAMFCEMAKVLGYEAHQISGRVPLRAGGYGAHSWVEVKIGNTFYVFDPDFTNETKYNGYQISYGQSGTWQYEKLSVMS